VGWVWEPGRFSERQRALVQRAIERLRAAGQQPPAAANRGVEVWETPGLVHLRWFALDSAAGPEPTSVLEVTLPQKDGA
jgi:hypothetical protein